MFSVIRTKAKEKNVLLITSIRSLKCIKIRRLSIQKEKGIHLQEKVVKSLFPTLYKIKDKLPNYFRFRVMLSCITISLSTPIFFMFSRMNKSGALVPYDLVYIMDFLLNVLAFALILDMIIIIIKGQLNILDCLTYIIFKSLCCFIAVALILKPVMVHEPFFFIKLIRILFIEGYSYQSLDQFYFIKACEQLSVVEHIYISPRGFINSFYLVSDDKLVEYARGEGFDIELLKIEADKIKTEWLKASNVRYIKEI